MKRFAIFFLACSLLGCWPRAVEEAAHATNTIDEQVAAAYTTHADVCREASSDWAEYDACMAPWNKASAQVGRLREVTLALDLAKGRKAQRAAACEWFKVVQTLPDVPAVVVAKRSKWRRKC